MNSEEKKIMEIFGRENHFQVPEGYFDSLADQIMARVPQTEEAAQPAEARVVGIGQWRKMWQRIPLRRVAAVAGVAVLLGSGTLYALHQSQAQHRALQSQAHVAATVKSAYSEDATIDQMADYAMMDSQDFYAQIVAEN